MVDEGWKCLGPETHIKMELRRISFADPRWHLRIGTWVECWFGHDMSRAQAEHFAFAALALVTKTILTEAKTMQAYALEQLNDTKPEPGAGA